MISVENHVWLHDSKGGDDRNEIELKKETYGGKREFYNGKYNTIRREATLKA